ncbi:MAG: MFS transporter [Hyphomicrobiales bacterium]|nr:MFS transporter [Hyphomicrobiales bacterium]MCP5371660.1 MFS transporter [Hyphomicrobiales bacterium]
MLVLFLIVFVDLVGFGIVIPLLPFYGEHYHATPDQVGLLMAVYSLTQFVAAPFWGRLSDRVGRRPVLLVSLAGLAASYVWLGLAGSLAELFAARALGGLMAGNIATAFAYVADVTTPENRARGMGAVGAAFGLGFIFGPAIGGMLAGADPATADFRTPAFAAAGLSGTALVMALVLLKESLSAEVRARIAGRPRRNRLRQFADALALPHVGLLIALSFLATFVFAGMETTFAMWSRRQFGWGPAQNGYLFAFVGVISALIQGGLVGRLARQVGEAWLIVGGAVALALGMVLIPLSTGLGLLVPAMAVVAFGFSIMSPSLNSLISLQVGEESQGGVMGVTRSATTLARVLGPAWAGMLFAALGRDWPYFGGALVMAVVVALGLRARAARGAGAKRHG